MACLPATWQRSCAQIRETLLARPPVAMLQLRYLHSLAPTHMVGFLGPPHLAVQMCNMILTLKQYNDIH